MLMSSSKSASIAEITKGMSDCLKLELEFRVCVYYKSYSIDRYLKIKIIFMKIVINHLYSSEKFVELDFL